MQFVCRDVSSLGTYVTPSMTSYKTMYYKVYDQSFHNEHTTAHMKAETATSYHCCIANICTLTRFQKKKWGGILNDCHFPTIFSVLLPLDAYKRITS